MHISSGIKTISSSTRIITTNCIGRKNNLFIIYCSYSTNIQSCIIITNNKTSFIDCIYRIIYSSIKSKTNFCVSNYISSTISGTLIFNIKLRRCRTISVIITNTRTTFFSSNIITIIITNTPSISIQTSLISHSPTSTSPSRIYFTSSIQHIPGRINYKSNNRKSGNNCD